MVVAVITGGGGFLGQCLASDLIRDPTVHIAAAPPSPSSSSDGQTTENVTRIILADVSFPPPRELQPAVASGVTSGLVELRVGDVSDPNFCSSLLSASAPPDGGGSASVGSVSVFHLGAVMSGAGESDFDLCLRVNLLGTLNMLESSRSHPSRVRFVYASAGATVGSGLPTDWVSAPGSPDGGGDDVISDRTRAAPHTTYGTTKACGELLLSDYSRRGFVDGRGARLPTVVVRAGRPNAAATGCFSAVVREPLAGRGCAMPLNPDVWHAVTGFRNAVGALRALHDLSPDVADDVMGPYDRTVFLPSRAVTLGEMESAVRAVVDPSCRDLLGAVEYHVDEFLSGLVGGFPTSIDAGRALRLGIPDAPTPEEMVREYAESFPDALAGGIELVPTRGEGGGAAGGNAAVARADAEIETADASAGAASGDDVVVAVITGAGSGIGRAAAVRLSEGGWGIARRPDLTDSCRICVVLAGRRRDALEETSGLIYERSPGASCLAVPTDVTDVDSVSELFERARAEYGRIDLLFNNAGVNTPRCPARLTSPSDFRGVMDVNLTGSFLCARAAMNVMAAQSPRGGRIINSGSVSADRPRPGGVAYTCSKHGVTGLTKTLNLEGRDMDIAVGQVDFGNVRSAVSSITQTGGALQADGTLMAEPEMDAADAADAVWAMARLPLDANVLWMTVMATKMPLVGRG